MPYDAPVIADARSALRSRFSPGAGVAYLDAATYGLPPDTTVAAMHRALDMWQAGTAQWIGDWDRPAERARVAFASLVGTVPERVTLLPQLSVGMGIVAANLGPGDEIVVPDDEFTSVLFPLLLAKERGATVREVPQPEVADAIRPTTTHVAFSLVQMQTGRVAALADILDRAEAVGARVTVDATQGIPFVDVAQHLGRIDHLLLSGYKHVLCPRGTAFLVHGRGDGSHLSPIAANWRAADDPYGRYFGGPLTLAADARRFDVSLAWLPWVGAVESLEALVTWKPTGAFDDVLAQSRSLAGRLGTKWEGASLVCAPIRDAAGASDALAEAGVRASVRGTAIRCAPHVWTTDEDLDRAVEALTPFLG